MKRVGKSKEQYSYHLVLRPEPANARAEDAVRGYLISLQKEGERIPREDRGNIFTTTTVAI
jgi:hypothetical protein